MSELQRTLEPEVMDTPQEARDYNDMDHSDVNRAFVSDFLAAGFSEGDLLDLGTGTALIPIELCHQLQGRDTEFRIMAVDLAGYMLDQARLNIAESEIDESRIQLAQIDAKQLPYPDAMFDAVMSNSIVHHIPQPGHCLSESVRVTRPGGLLFFRDLARPANEAEVSKLVQEYTGQENEHSQQMFEDSLRAALSLDEIRELVIGLGFPAESVQRTTDRHWTWQATRA